MQMMRAEKANIATSGTGHSGQAEGVEPGPCTRTAIVCPGWQDENADEDGPQSRVMCRHLHRQTASAAGHVHLLPWYPGVLASLVSWHELLINQRAATTMALAADIKPEPAPRYQKKEGYPAG